MIKKSNFNKNNTCNNFCCTKIENFSVTLGNNQILKDVNLHIHCGELTSIIGPNGAGKSTLLKALLGEVKHTGNLSFIGNDCLLQILIQIRFSYKIQRIGVKRSKHLIIICGYKNHFLKTSGILPLSCNINSVLLRQHNIHKCQLISFITRLQLTQSAHAVHFKFQTVLSKQGLHLHLHKLCQNFIIIKN